MRLVALVVVTMALPPPPKRLHVRGGFTELKQRAKELVTVYGPIALAFDFVTLQVIGLTVFLLLSKGIITPPQFILNKVKSKTMKRGLNVALTIAMCETIFLPPRLVWACYMTPKIATWLK